MKLYKQNKGITKVIHDDGSETSIKIVESGSYCLTTKNEVREVFKPNNKYSIMISSSVGCKVGCKFCHLTIKKCKYKDLTSDQVNKNIQEALRLINKKDIETKDVKLCFMGMGDCGVDFFKTNNIIQGTLKYIINNKLASGVDSIDLGISLTYSKKPANLKKSLTKIKDELEIFCIDNKIKNKRGVRVFYSYHHVDPYVREQLIPNATSGKEVLLSSICKEVDVELIFHYMFIEDINDSFKDVHLLISLFQQDLKDHQLRILRFNPVLKYSPLKESKYFNKILDVLNEFLPNVKFQISPGKELDSACGMFSVLIR